MKKMLKMMLAAVLLGITVFISEGEYARAEEPTANPTASVYPDGFDPVYYANK